jgi:hypothetical protein
VSSLTALQSLRRVDLRTAPKKVHINNLTSATKFFVLLFKFCGVSPCWSFHFVFVFVFVFDKLGLIHQINQMIHYPEHFPNFVFRYPYMIDWDVHSAALRAYPHQAMDYPCQPDQAKKRPHGKLDTSLAQPSKIFPRHLRTTSGWSQPVI